MPFGTVLWFNKQRGIGFIKPEKACDANIFVHHSGIAGHSFRALLHDQHVEYEVVQGEQGPRAQNVQAATR
ncbi:CspA family cold shock protein [Nocardia sp. GP40]|uniref:cold-shock protein n=1 Tax=Nocardia sp. GP40 TaxID=3156268 RepID=UPI003D1EF546